MDTSTYEGGKFIACHPIGARSNFILHMVVMESLLIGLNCYKYRLGFWGYKRSVIIVMPREQCDNDKDNNPTPINYKTTGHRFLLCTQYNLGNRLRVFYLNKVIKTRERGYIQPGLQM